MKEIRVVGDINKVQSNLDFYISVTSLDRDITVEEYKKSYFDGYIRDAKKELNDSIESVKKQIAEKKKEILKKQTVEKLKKERVEREKARRAEEERKAEEVRKLEEQRKAEEAKQLEEAKKLEEQGKVEETEKLEEQRKAKESEHLDKAKTQEEGKIEKFKNVVNTVEECDHGVYLDECSIVEKDTASSGNVEYVSCGTDIDELLESDEKDGNDSPDKCAQGNVEYVSCGTDIDELLESDADKDNGKQENVEFVEQGTILEDCLDTQDINSNEETYDVNDGSDEIEESSVPDVFNDSYDGELFDDSFDEDESDDLLGEDDLGDFPLEQGNQETKDSSSDIFDDIETEDVSQIEADSSKIIPISSGVKKEVSMEDDGKFAENLPRDVRDFLKLHPNSDMSYVLKFYSKKDIDKQIKLGRIFKRKGKLMI